MKYLSIVASLVLTVAVADHCDTFCPSLLETCSGANEQYATEAECQTECKLHPRTFMDGAFFGDTFECRTYHLHVAGTSAELAQVHCPHAGKDGGDVCVPKDRCENFCTTFKDVTCTVDAAEDVNYKNQTKCIAECKKFPQSGLQGAVSGDTYQCREYHLGVAHQMPVESADHEVHCGHARIQPTRHCVSSVTTCQAFCTAFTTYCDVSNETFTDYTNCVPQCEAFSTLGQLNDVSGDTLQCREYHLGIAALGRGNRATLDTHCVHASLNGGGVCVELNSASGGLHGSGVHLLLVALALVLVM